MTRADLQENLGDQRQSTLLPVGAEQGLDRGHQRQQPTQRRAQQPQDTGVPGKSKAAAKSSRSGGQRAGAVGTTPHTTQKRSRGLTAINNNPPVAGPASFQPPARNPHTGLFFSSLDDATKATDAMKKPLWTPPPNDQTIPNTDAERQICVRLLVAAMKNTSNILDSKRPKRWDHAPGDPSKFDHFYDEYSVEKTCWEIEEFAERLHKEGPNILQCHDRAFLLSVARTKALTFGERMESIIELMETVKARCDKLMKGGHVEQFVADAPGIFKTSLGNKKYNPQRAVYIRLGKTSQNAANNPTANNASTSTPQIAAAGQIGSVVAGAEEGQARPVVASTVNGIPVTLDGGEEDARSKDGQLKEFENGDHTAHNLHGDGLVSDLLASRDMMASTTNPGSVQGLVEDIGPIPGRILLRKQPILLREAQARSSPVSSPPSSAPISSTGPPSLHAPTALARPNALASGKRNRRDFEGDNDEAAAGTPSASDRPHKRRRPSKKPRGSSQ
ncbi:hypothetical protein BDV95DRAFT_568246 [Massariosphaeria phaeospora]|uniref:Uncharacterized protein n=1 Tax=Massariosphaeria phaeospora TaxID=100035 RepID=A0A7C8I9U1_9PLEO|nr:hypothetical protein BDV95DRAFT_568246 [Massariosphaeria phaeospora]